MLSKFSVSNFKSFNSRFTLDFSKNSGYQFNSESIRNGIVNNAIIYGHNGSGKSNLGLAIFDIIQHLTDFEKNEGLYSNYLNALNGSKFAEFEYEFKFDNNVVKYNYKKTDNLAVVFEHLSINQKTVALIDRSINNIATIKLKGTESLNKNISNENLSLLKYIRNNSILVKNPENTLFQRFLDFVDGMLFFRSLDVNMYLGLETGTRDIQEEIIEKNKVKDLEKFLNEAQIESTLTVIQSSFNKKILAFDFKGVKIPFYDAASTGTRALTILYFWLQKINLENDVSFVFIDEFDAYYHHSLAQSIVQQLKKTNIQFVLTTHNISIISNEILRPDCYFFMNKDHIKSLAQRTNKELREAHNIEKMYKAGSFNG